MKNSRHLCLCALLLFALANPAASLKTPKLQLIFQGNSPYTMTDDFWASFERSVIGWQ